MYHVVVASINPAKVKAVSQVFQQIFETCDIQVSGVAADSQVSPQPMTDEETYLGAKNRLEHAKKQQPDADYWVSIEAGIDGNQAFAWILTASQTRHGESRSASFLLPETIAAELHQGKELGQVMSELTGVTNIKQKGGAIGAITNGLLTRASVYEQAIILAVSQLTHPFYLPSQD